MPRVSKVTKRATALKMIAGAEKHLDAGKTYTMAGARYSRDELLAVFRAHIAALDDVDAARAAFRGSVVAERKAAAKAERLARLIKGWVLGFFAPGSAAIAEFGVKTPKDPGPKTAEAKRRMVERARATRESKKSALAKARKRPA